MRTILFVCTGNTCRSPMAEAFARTVISGDLVEGIVPSEVLIASAKPGNIENSGITGPRNRFGKHPTHPGNGCERRSGADHDSGAS